MGPKMGQFSTIFRHRVGVVKIDQKWHIFDNSTGCKILHFSFVRPPPPDLTKMAIFDLFGPFFDPILDPLLTR